MTKIPLQQQWKTFQLERVQNIQYWYQEHYIQMQIQDPVIKYIIAWAVFNALYNTSDLPNNHLPDKEHERYVFKEKYGHKIPKILVDSDTVRVNKIAEKLASLKGFSSLFTNQDIRHHINAFIEHIPSVTQDEGIDANRPIQIIINRNGQWIEAEFMPASIRGLASLDHRLFLTDGYRFFEYSSIDNPWDENRNLKDITLTTKQLLTILYQLRNNTVHGGSTAFHTKEIILDGQPILEAIIEFIFNHREDVFTGEKQWQPTNKSRIGSSSSMVSSTKPAVLPM